MQIRDLEHATGLDRATIRFYEKEGLICPQRQENGYRTYSVQDEKSLLRIKLLRSLGMSLETIRNLQQGREDFPSALEMQRRTLENTIRQDQRAKEVCLEIRDQVRQYEELDATPYLKKLQPPQAEIPGKQAENVPEFHEQVQLPSHPFRRFFARMLDHALLLCLLEVLLIVILRVRPYGETLSTVISFGSWFLAVPVQALCLSLWGTTPGKWVMALSVRSVDGNRLTFREAFRREWAVLQDGLGFTIPIWTLWKMYKSYQRYRQWPDLDWDEDCEYNYGDWAVRRKAFLAGICCGLFACVFLTSRSQTRPKHLGTSLTIEQFAENYNFARTILDANSQPRLQPDGEKYPQEGIENSAIVYIGAHPDDNVGNFQYVVEDGRLREIRYANRWTNIQAPISMPDQCVVAVYAIVTAQRDISNTEIGDFFRLWQENQNQSSGTLECGRVRIQWKYTLNNCDFLLDGGILALDSDADSDVSLEFKIVVLE